jgi:hypothetical protein
MAKNTAKAFVTPDRPPKYKVGDLVEYFFQSSGRGIVGEVIQDRGPIGWSGVHQYVVRPRSEYSGTEPVYASEDDLRPAKSPSTSK